MSGSYNQKELGRVGFCVQLFHPREEVKIHSKWGSMHFCAGN
jgi:hypothetical protein